MLILGVDPGARNYGLAVLDHDGKLVWGPRSGRTKSGDWREAFSRVLADLDNVRFNRVVIESVGWYGSRKGMYALNRLVGALWARLGPDITTLVMPNAKIKVPSALRKKAKNEHEADAIALALAGISQLSQQKNSKKKSAATRTR